MAVSSQQPSNTAHENLPIGIPNIIAPSFLIPMDTFRFSNSCAQNVPQRAIPNQPDILESDKIWRLF